MNQSSMPSEAPARTGLRRFLGTFAQARRSRFSPEEVRQRLRSRDDTNERSAAVHATAARTAVWSGLVSPKLACDLGPAAARLPTVVYWYCQGLSAQEIGKRLSPLGGAWDAERALAAAAALIAYVLNQEV